MEPPKENKDREPSLPDSFGTGKQPVWQKSYLSITLILLSVLLLTNLVTLALYFRLKNANEKQIVKNTFFPGTGQLSTVSPVRGGNAMQTQINPSGQILSDEEITQKLLPSVVKIAAQSEPETVIDTGIVLTQDGYILTNAHEIASLHALFVTLSDGSTHTAICTGYDTVADLAVLKIDAQGLTPAELGDADGVQNGDSLWLLSNSGKLKTVTACEEETISLHGGQTRLLTVDLPEDGILVNRSGQVIGLWTAAGAYEGQMLPICTARSLADDLINYGCINPEASLGIQITEISEIQRRYWQLPEGVIVSQIVPNGTAALAGICAGDLILQIDAWKIKNAEDYEKTMERLHPGDTVQLLVYRMGQEYNITIVIQNAQEDR